MGAAIPDVGTLQQYAAFGVAQTGALEVCDGKRELAVDTMKMHNEYVDRLTKKVKRPWWKPF